ncbi:MAG TPA: TetR/AcrR family transcriptional regulator [Polyangiales bacterium]|nr:TetR/AcrR family transcriptional regulator [Polyangiales bacterium]
MTTTRCVLTVHLDGVKNNLDGVRSSVIGYRYGVPRAKKPEKANDRGNVAVPPPRRQSRRGPTPSRAPYHHGNLRQALLDAALCAIREHGVSELSLRDVARRAGVSHAAPAHHFGDKAGLLTALATAGFGLFTQAQRDARERGGADPVARFSWTGWAYVMFADQNREYFEIMFRPELLNREDAMFRAAADAAHQVLLETMRPVVSHLSEEQLLTQTTSAWALAHGLSRLWLDGNLSAFAGLTDIDQAARVIFGLPPKA